MIRNGRQEIGHEKGGRVERERERGMFVWLEDTSIGENTYICVDFDIFSLK
jgi:hypothetical protein